VIQVKPFKNRARRIGKRWTTGIYPQESEFLAGRATIANRRPGLFPVTSGRLEKAARLVDAFGSFGYATPWEMLRRLPGLAGYLKSELTRASSDTAAAEAMQAAKRKLFASFHQWRSA
jgi:hypothetical protein